MILTTFCAVMDTRQSRPRSPAMIGIRLNWNGGTEYKLLRDGEGANQGGRGGGVRACARRRRRAERGGIYPIVRPNT